MKDTVEPRSLKSIFAIGIATGFFFMHLEWRFLIT